MTPDRWRAVDAAFDAALGLDPAARAAFLGDTFAGDPALVAEVEALLGAHEGAGAFLESPPQLAAFLAESSAFAHPASGDGAADEGTPAEDDAADPLLGRRVGPYRLAGVLGRGGMGAVYLAERADGAFRQRVALKLVRDGLASPDALRRFRQERSVLARLDHAGIARLVDGGVTDGGLPFLAMEVVAGEPLTRYAERHALGVDARLGLFLQVCEAVAYAHRHLVVHRDLKPSNILVADDERAAPHVKLLDFGIAKLLDDPDADGPDVGDLHTRTGAQMMTPAYAAPEQIAGGAVTTATDVYALGVLLYELLTGRRPAPARATPDETGPARPSAAVLTRPSAATRFGPARPASAPPAAGTLPPPAGTDALRLRRRLAGDLDTICLKALQAAPERRYPSADALAGDVRRHLAGLPVHARPDTAGYRLRSFVRRHRVGVAAFALVCASVVGGAGVALYQARVATTARVRAETEVLKASTAVSFLESLFAQGEGRLEDRTARSLLDQGERRAAELRDDPDAHARVLGLLGGIYRTTGDFGPAERLLRAALAVRERALSPGDLLLADARFDLGYLLDEADRLAEADSLYRLALDARRARLDAADGPVVFGTFSRAHALLRRGRTAEAEGLFRASLEGAERMTEPEERDSHTSNALQGVAATLARRGEFAEAEALAARALALMLARYGPDDAASGAAWLHYGRRLRDAGHLARADTALRRGQATFERLFPAGHPWRAGADFERGVSLRRLGRAADARPYLERALSAERALGRGPRVAAALGELGGLLADAGRPADAEPLLREALALRERYPDYDPALLAAARRALAACRGALGRPLSPR